MFAKYWGPGEVKTRLAAHVGEEPAARFHRTCVETLAARFSDVGERRVLAYAPEEREREFTELAGQRWRLEAQSRGDLGERMSKYFAAAFEAGSTAVVLIGSDSPDLPRRLIDEAYDQLNDADVVLGPAADGGYYLIGFSRDLPDAFAGIAWSTPDVLRQTLARLSAARRRYHLLPPWYDVDTIADLARLHAALASDADDELRSLRKVVNQMLAAP